MNDKTKAAMFSLLIFSIIVTVTTENDMISFAQSVNDDYPISNGTLSGFISDDGTVGPVGIVNELYKAHSDVTGIMIDNSETIAHVGYVNEEVYLEATWVDEENQKLVLLLDPVQMLDPLDIHDIQEELGIMIPLDIKYGYFIPEASSSQATSCPAGSGSSTCYYWGRYVDRCLPTHTTSRCGTYATAITGAGYALPTLLSSGTTPIVPTSTSTTPATSSSTSIIFQDDFANGISKWTESGQREWQWGTLDDSAAIPGETGSNKIAEADDCDDQSCILTLRNSVDLSGYSAATLEFHRYVDRGLDSGEYLKVEVGNDNIWTEIFKWTDGTGDDGTWHKESYNLSNYLNNGFKVRFVTEQSSSREDVGVDNVKITGTPNTQSQCTLDIVSSLQSDGTIDSAWNSCSDIKRYKVYYSENGNGNRYLESTTGTTHTFSNPGEGNNYTIKVKAQYSSNNRYTQYFESNRVIVPVTDIAKPTITIPNNFSVTLNEGTTSTILRYAVSAYDVVDGTIPTSCTPASGSTVTVGATGITCTAVDSSGNGAVATFTVTVNEYVAPVNPQTSTVKEFYGGQQIIMSQNTTAAQSGHIEPQLDSGTITIGVTKTNGQIGFVTAGHVVEFETTNNIIPHGFYLSGNITYDVDGENIVTKNTLNTNATLLNTINPTIFRNETAGDVAFVPITESNVVISQTEIAKHSGTLINVICGSADSIPLGNSIEIYGIHNNAIGTLRYNNVTATIGDGVTLANMAIGHYDSKGGDSGAPIIVTDRGINKLIGIHQGKVCTFYDTDTSLLLQDVHNSVQFCPNGNSLYYKLFTPWENAKSTLNLR